MKRVSQEQEKHLFGLSEFSVTLPETGHSWRIVAKSAAQAKRKIMRQKLNGSLGIKLAMLRAKRIT